MIALLINVCSGMFRAVSDVGASLLAKSFASRLAPTLGLDLQQSIYKV